MFHLGKALQLSGLVTLVWAFIVGVWGDDMSGEMLLLGLGAAAFGLGSLVLRRGRSA